MGWPGKDCARSIKRDKKVSALLITYTFLCKTNEQEVIFKRRAMYVFPFQLASETRVGICYFSFKILMEQRNDEGHQLALSARLCNNNAHKFYQKPDDVCRIIINISEFLSFSTNYFRNPAFVI